VRSNRPLRPDLSSFSRVRRGRNFRPRSVDTLEGRAVFSPLWRGEKLPLQRRRRRSDPPRLGSAASLSPRRRHQIASRVHARGYTHVTSTCNVSPATPAREILLFLFLTTLFFTEDINSRAREGRKRNRKKKEDALAAWESNGVASERCLASQAALFRPFRPLGRGKKGGARLQLAPLLSRTPDVSN